MSNVQAFICGKMLNFEPSANFTKFSKKISVFALKTGMNDCKIFILKAELSILRIGFQTRDAIKKFKKIDNQQHIFGILLLNFDTILHRTVRMPAGLG